MLALNNSKDDHDATYLYGMKVDNSSDPQQFAVYSWQWEIAHKGELSDNMHFRDIINLTKDVCAKYRISVPVIHTGLLPLPAYDEEGGHALYFPCSVTNTMTAAHELAHVICVHKYGTRVEGHGAEYVGCFIELLAYLRNEPENKLINSAISKNIMVL